MRLIPAVELFTSGSLVVAHFHLRFVLLEEKPVCIPRRPGLLGRFSFASAAAPGGYQPRNPRTMYDILQCA